MYTRERSSLEEVKFPGGGGRRKRNPSFSSSLLDSIYRSIDESNGGEVDLGFVRESKKQSSSVSKREETKGGSREKTNLRRAMMIENWVERQSVHSSMFTNSASSSSESSSGAAFSSSDQTESCYKRRSKQSPAVVSVRSEHSVKPKSENGSGSGGGGGGGFTKTKLRALKIYGELKKAKQPISPGGRIASFINSIFNSSNVKKAKMCYVGAVEDVSTSEHVTKSTYSSFSAPSTFSRSCLSKPSSRSKKSSNDNKRSVRFYPISVILGEDDTQRSKCVYEQEPSLLPKPTFQKYARTSGQSFRRSFCDEDGDGDGDGDDDESEAESYSSSDLFELNQPVGIGRYTEELPVYETTNFRTNQAIAKGLIL